MKAFISYSITDNNEFILTMLSSRLREQNLTISTSQNFYSNTLDFGTMNEISDSHLFIGLITGTGVERTRVLDEWRYARQRNVPNILLVEDTVPMNQNFTGNYIRFNRRNPQPAINEINRRMNMPRQASSNSDDIVPWVLGGAALLAILALFSGKK